MNDEGHIELNHFTGEYILSGICVENTFTGDDEQYTKVSLVLDDVIYTFEEDPQDGLRSCLGDVYIDEWQSIIDNFEGQEVIGELRNVDGYEHAICFVRSDNDELVLRIGTLDISHDYPFFVFDFYPEVMRLDTPLDEDY